MAEPLLVQSDWTEQTFEDTSSVCRGIIRAIDEQLGIGVIAAEHYARGACLAFFLCDIERSRGWQHGIGEGDNVEFGLVEMSEEDSQFIAQSATLKPHLYKLSKSHTACELTPLELGSVVLEELLLDHPRYEGVVVTELEPSVQHHQFGSYYGDEEPKRGLLRLVGAYENTRIPPIHQRYSVPSASSASSMATLQSHHEGEAHMLIARGTMLHFEGRDLLTTCIVLHKGDRVEFDVYRDRTNADVPFGATNIVFLDPDREQRQFGFIYRFFFKQAGQYGAVEQKFGQIKSTYQDELFWHQSEMLDRDEEIQIGDEVEFVREIDEQHGRVKATRITFLPKNTIPLTELSSEVFTGKVESSTSYSKPPLIEYHEAHAHAQQTAAVPASTASKQLIEVQTHSNEHYILVKGDLVEFRTESKQENPTNKRAVQVVVTREAERTQHGVVHKLQKQVQQLASRKDASSDRLQKYMNLYGEIEYHERSSGGLKRQIWFYLSEWFDPGVDIYEGLAVEFNVLDGHNSPHKQRAVRIRPLSVPLTKQQRMLQKQQQEQQQQLQQQQLQLQQQQQQQQRQKQKQREQREHRERQQQQQQQRERQLYEESTSLPPQPHPRQPQRKSGGRKPPIFRSLGSHHHHHRRHHLEPPTPPPPPMAATTADVHAATAAEEAEEDGAPPMPMPMQTHMAPRQSPLLISSDASVDDSQQTQLSKAKKARMRKNRNKRKNSNPKTSSNAVAEDETLAAIPAVVATTTTTGAAAAASLMEEGTPHEQPLSRSQSRSQSAFALHSHSGWNDGYYEDHRDDDEYERGGGGGRGTGDWRVSNNNNKHMHSGYTPRGRGSGSRGGPRGGGGVGGARSHKQYNRTDRDRTHRERAQWNDDSQTQQQHQQTQQAQAQAQAPRKTSVGNNPIPSFDTMVAIEGIVEQPMRSKHGHGAIRYQWKRKRRLHAEGTQPTHDEYEEFEEEKRVEYDYDSKANWQRRIFLTQGDRVRLFFRLIDDNEAQLAYVTLIDPVYKQRMYGECYYYHPTQTYYLHNKYGRDFIELWPYHIVDKKVQSYNLENEMFVFDLAEHSSFGTDNLTATRCRWVRLEDEQHFHGTITAAPSNETDYGCIAYEDPNDGEDKSIRYSLSSLSKQYRTCQKVGDDVKFHIEHILTKSTYDVIPPTAINIDSRVMYRKKTAMK